MKHPLTWILLSLFSWANAQEYSATYRLTFVGEWSRSTHPHDYPNGAHFSQPIGHTHNHDGWTWAPGLLATMGIQFMAETGSVSNLTHEINDLITAGHAESVLLGDGIGAQTSSLFEFTVTQSHPLVSLTSMIAPSPDWFVGVAGLNLQAAGQWRDEVMIDLYPYDGGTDAGVTFNSADVWTLPPEPIALINTHPLPDGIPMGTFLFTRLSTTGTPSEAIFSAGFD